MLIESDCRRSRRAKRFGHFVTSWSVARNLANFAKSLSEAAPRQGEHVIGRKGTTKPNFKLDADKFSGPARKEEACAGVRRPEKLAGQLES
jgi:hypothetical protein